MTRRKVIATGNDRGGPMATIGKNQIPPSSRRKKPDLAEDSCASEGLTFYCDFVMSSGVITVQSKTIKINKAMISLESVPVFP